MSERKREPNDAQLHEAAGLTLLAEALDTSAPDPALRARLLSACSGPERWTPWAAEIARVFGLALDDARDALRRIHDPEAWLPGVWPGSERLVTDKLMQRHALIARLPAGMRIARHRHYGRELTYILDGEMIEDSSLRHRSGALVDKPRGTEHEVTVSAEAECLVVFGVVPD